MKHSVTALLLTLTVTAASSAVTSTVAHAATDDTASKFQTFDATPKAPRKDVVTDRQIVVEPKFAPPKAPPVASLPQPVETAETIVDEPAKAIPQPQAQVIEQEPVQPVQDEEIFAPQPKTEAAKVEIPTVFTETQKDLFAKLSPEQQTVMVKKLITKHGYDAMYPADVSRTYLDDYRTKQTKADDAYYDQGTYQDTGYNTSYGYTTSYGSSYGSSYNNCQ